MTDARDRVELASEVMKEFDELLSYVAERNPTAAESLRTKLLEEFARLARLAPRLDGRKVTLRTGEPCRQSFVHPVTIYYDRSSGVLRVLRVYHHAREPIVR